MDKCEVAMSGAFWLSETYREGIIEQVRRNNYENDGSNATYPQSHAYMPDLEYFLGAPCYQLVELSFSNGSQEGQSL